VLNNPLTLTDPTGYDDYDDSDSDEFDYSDGDTSDTDQPQTGSYPCTPCGGSRFPGGDGITPIYGGEILGIGGGIAGYATGGILGGGWNGAGGANFGGVWQDIGSIGSSGNSPPGYWMTITAPDETDSAGITQAVGILTPMNDDVGESPNWFDASGAWAFGDGPVCIVQPDGTLEIRTGGSLSWRDNNPGNIRPGFYAARDGSLGTNYSQNGPFAIFPDLPTGEDALTDLLSSKYGEDSLSTALSAYAPPGENNTAAYISNVSNVLNVSPSTVINTLSDIQFENLEGAIVTQEDFYSGTVTTVPPPGH
jgi:hypothetical protein